MGLILVQSPSSFFPGDMAYSTFFAAFLLQGKLFEDFWCLENRFHHILRGHNSLIILLWVLVLAIISRGRSLPVFGNFECFS